MTDVKKAVVLAAGRGDRLQARTNGSAKCLVRVAGRPIIDYVLASLRRAGITDVLIVVGRHGDQIEAHVADGGRHRLRVSYAVNEAYDRGNAGSLLVALRHLGPEPFLLAMSDHICSPELLQTLCAAGSPNAIAIDRSQHTPERIDEATKVATAGERIAGLGKQLERWDAIDTGFSRWAPESFAAAANDESELAALMSRIASNGTRVAPCDITGHLWLDIDTEDDLREAERLLREHARDFA
jgi:choline kinase